MQGIIATGTFCCQNIARENSTYKDLLKELYSTSPIGERACILISDKHVPPTMFYWCITIVHQVCLFKLWSPHQFQVIKRRSTGGAPHPLAAQSPGGLQATWQGEIQPCSEDPARPRAGPWRSPCHSNFHTCRPPLCRTDCSFKGTVTSREGH